MAEALVGRELADRSFPAVVESAGFLQAGQPASDATIEVMGERGLDLTDHRSRVVSPELVHGADLVLTMERRHARELLVEAGEATPVHTLKGFLRLAAAVAPAPGGVTEWLLAVAATGRQDPLLGDGLPDEISDPHGRPLPVHRRAADEIASAAGALGVLLAGVAREAPR
jgi:protein-tyrosine-phosphatase